MFHKTIRLVTFDVTNTLLRFRVTPGQQYTEVAADCGVRLDGEEMARKFVNNYKTMNFQHPNFGKRSNISWDEWWRRVVHNTLATHVEDPKVLEKITTRLIESYKTKEYWLVNDGSVDILKFLKERKVTLGVISNFDPRLHQVLVNVGLREYFDFVVISYDAGFPKPAREIFEKALKESRVSKLEQCSALHVGDNEELDYRGALAAGWQAALVHSKSSINPNAFSDLKHLHNSLLDNKNIFSN